MRNPLTILIAFLALTAFVSAEVPQVINYQGRLTDDTGEPITNTSPGVQLTFTIYNHATNNGPIFIEWSSGPQMVPVEDGLFNYLLGSNSPLPNDLFSTDTTRWLGIKVGADPEIAPREKLTSLAYAYHALRADTAAVALTTSTGNGWVDDGAYVRLQTSSDKVGIGISSPSSKLEVYEDYSSIMGISITNPNTSIGSAERLSFNDENGSIAGIQTMQLVGENRMEIFNSRPNPSISLEIGGGLHLLKVENSHVCITDDLFVDYGYDGTPEAELLVSPNYANFQLYSSGTPTSTLYGQEYGTLVLTNNDGVSTVSLDATNESGGQLYLNNSLGTNTVRLYGTTSAGGGLSLDAADGNLRWIATAGSDGGLMTLYNLSTPWITFEADLNGDASVNFPDNAIAADEIKDEPGIASELNSTIFTLSSTTMQDIETVTITIPTSGYIVVTAKAWGRHNGTTGTATSRAQIDETSGGSLSIPYYTLWGGYAYPSTSYYYESIFLQRVYQKTAGTYTFRLEAAQAATSAGASHYIGDPIVVATFYPTNYGSVSTFVSSSEAGQFDKAEMMPSSRQNGDEIEYIDNNYKVDLHELQARAEELRKELKKTEMKIRDQERRQKLEEEQQKQTRRVIE